MNAVDIVLIIVLTACALRGYWRGFFRELFGLLGLAAGAIAAITFTAEGVEFLKEYVTLAPPILSGIAFVGIFIVAHTAVNLVGLIFDRLAKAMFLRGVNRIAGAVFATGKGAVVLALVLFAVHLSQVLPVLDEQIMRSTLGRPLVLAAGELIDAAQAEAQEGT
jgi:membrane protein required for colicin V production